MKSVNFLFAMLATSLAISMNAQDTNTASHLVDISIPEVAIIDIETAEASTTISLGGTAPTEAGEAVVFGGTDNTLWLNYSSIVGDTETSRNVSVSYVGTLPGGMDLKVVAATDAGNGDGTVGTPSAEVSLTTTDQNIITGIGSAYTADGVSNGHQLTYTLDVDTTAGSYANLNFDDDTQLTITYTLQDD